MKKRNMIPAVLLTLLSMAGIAQDTSQTDATLKTATVFYGFGAELTHKAKVKVSEKTRQIIISGLATTADANSIQVSIPESVALLSQKFRIYSPSVPESTNPLIKKYTDSIIKLNKQISRLDNRIEIESSTMEKMGRLIEMIISHNDNKVTTSEEALKLINANTNKMEKSKTEIYKLTVEKNDIREIIAALQTKINELSNITPEQRKPVGQLLLQVKCSRGEEVPVDVSYFTNNAGFTPLYDVRVNSKTNEIRLIYKAGIYQNTGIDWDQTKLTLSTANPNWSGTTPMLNPWYLQYFEPRIYPMQQAARANMMPMNTIPGAEKKMKDVIVANDNQVEMMAAGDETVNPSTIQNYTTLTENQLNTTYMIDLPYDIKSDGEMQSVTIKEEKITAVLKNYAVPKLCRDAFLLAEISDWESLGLLPGIANIIMDDTYLGRTQIDPNISTDTMNLSLGRDRRVVVNRTKVKEFTTTKRSGEFTIQTFTFEIAVKNNKTSDVTMILKDQYPLSQVKDIEVKLKEDGGASVNEELGVLTWNLELKAGESKKLRFSYTVKYPSDKKIMNL